MKLYELLQARTVINTHIDGTKSIAAPLAYKIMKLIKNTQNDCDFYQEKFNTILNEYGEKDEKGQLIQAEGGIKIQDGKMDECTTKIKELNETEVELPNIKFTLDELSPYSFSISDMMLIDELIQE